MKIKSITQDGVSDVYNMEVEDTHNFVIQGGVVAHNCADEFRYVAMSRPVLPRTTVKDDGYALSPLSMIFDIKREDIIARPKMERMEIIRDGE